MFFSWLVPAHLRNSVPRVTKRAYVQLPMLCPNQKHAGDARSTVQLPMQARSRLFPRGCGSCQSADGVSSAFSWPVTTKNMNFKNQTFSTVNSVHYTF